MTVTPAKSCVSVYFEEVDPWLVLFRLKSMLTVKEGSVANGQRVPPVRLRSVRAFSATSDPGWTRLFLGGLPNGATEQSIADFFVNNGYDEGAITPAFHQDRITGRRGGYAFLFVNDASLVKELIAGMWNYEGHSLKVEKVVGRSHPTADDQ